jgi:hypothetical protein
MDDDRHLFAARVGPADVGTGLQVRVPKRALRGAEIEAPAIEKAIQRSDARTSVGRHGGDVQDLHAGEQPRKLARVDAALWGGYLTQVRAGGCVAAVEERLQLLQVAFSLVRVELRSATDRRQRYSALSPPANGRL